MLKSNTVHEFERKVKDVYFIVLLQEESISTVGMHKFKFL